VRSAPLLVATETREKLTRVVEPFVDATLGRLDEPSQQLATGDAVAEVNGRRYPAHVRCILQHAPLMLRVVLVGFPRAVELERFGGDEVPGLADIVDEVIAGTLASLGNAADTAIAAAAAQRRGGFVVFFDYGSTGNIGVFVAKTGADLSEAIAIGAITNAPETVH
jgi:hypothetical protein